MEYTETYINRDIVSKYSDSVKCDRIFFIPNIPERKLRNALQSYAFIEKDEQPLVLIDDTLFGNAKDGALLTDRRIYTHNSGEKPQSFVLKDVQSVRLKPGKVNECKLYINGARFLKTNALTKSALDQFLYMLWEIVANFTRNVDIQSQSDRVRQIVSGYSGLKDNNISFAPNISEKKLRNALRAYAAIEENEQPLVLYDNSIFGSAKDGALLTDKKIYSACTWKKPLSFALTEIQAVSFIEGLLTINLYINGIRFLILGGETGEQFCYLLQDIAFGLTPEIGIQVQPEAVYKAEYLGGYGEISMYDSTSTVPERRKCSLSIHRDYLEIMGVGVPYKYISDVQLVTRSWKEIAKDATEKVPIAAPLRAADALLTARKKLCIAFTDKNGLECEMAFNVLDDMYMSSKNEEVQAIIQQHISEAKK